MADPSRKRASPPGPTGSRSNKRARLEVLPDNPLRFHREPQGTVQISTWNVAGLASSNAEKWQVRPRVQRQRHGGRFASALLRWRDDLLTHPPTLPPSRSQFGLRKYIEAEDAHVVCFTEVNQKDAARFFEREPSWQFLRDRYPFRYWGDRTATVSKFRPVSPPIFGFPDGKHYDPEDGRASASCLPTGRRALENALLTLACAGAVTLEFEELYLLATYVPNSGDKFKVCNSAPGLQLAPPDPPDLLSQDLDRRKAWIADFDPFIRSLDAKKPVIWTGGSPSLPPPRLVRPPPLTSPCSGCAGDFNVIRTVTPTSNETNDLAWPQNMGKLPGTHQVERDAHERLVGDPGWLENPRRRGKGFVDVWRLIYGDARRQYTCVRIRCLRLPLPAPFSSLAVPWPGHVETDALRFPDRHRHSSKKWGGWRRESHHLVLAPLPSPALDSLTRARLPSPLHYQPARTHAPRAVDGFIVSERLLHRIRDCQIRQQVKRQFWPPKDSVGIGALSDHWPVWLSLEMERL